MRSILKSGVQSVALLSVLLIAFSARVLKAQSVLLGPPEYTAGYHLAWMDDFTVDPAGPNGEMQNVDTPNGTTRPDWLYRPGTTLNCMLGTVANVQIAPNHGGMNLIDLASNPDASGKYMTYTCGGVITTRWFQYGYYEARVNISPASAKVQGFHTAFWTYGAGKDFVPLESTELDGFEAETQDQADPQYGNFTAGLYYHNIQDGGAAATPAPHPLTHWNQLPTLDRTQSHVWGFLWTPRGVKFYIDGANLPSETGSYAEGYPITGPFSAENIWLSSVGSSDGNACSTNPAIGPQLVFGVNPAQYTFAFSYVAFYQPTQYNWATPGLSQQTTSALNTIGVLPIPMNGIYIDGNSSNTSSRTLVGSWSLYNKATLNNPLINGGPQGYLGQVVSASQTAGDRATWTHQFGSADAGSYDVYLWNAAVTTYQLTALSCGHPASTAPDAAILTTVGVANYVDATPAGTLHAQPLTNTLSQKAAGQMWVPLNATPGLLTNTYKFSAQAPASVQMTVAAEPVTNNFTPHTTADAVLMVPVKTYLATSFDGYSESRPFTVSGVAGWAESSSKYVASTSATSAQWTVSPGAGTYDIFTWVPQDTHTDTTTTNASYSIRTAVAGSTPQALNVMDQQNNASQWYYLGSYPVTAAGAILQVSDIADTKYLRTNAIKLVRRVDPQYIACTSTTGLNGAGLYQETAGTWASGSNGYSGCSASAERTSQGTSTAQFVVQVPQGGVYHAYVHRDASLPTTATLTVASHSSTYSVCNGWTSNGSQEWIYLGDYVFAPDAYTDANNVTAFDHISIASSSGNAVSAIRLTYATSPGQVANVCSNREVDTY